jgi:hypothetical protein
MIRYEIGMVGGGATWRGGADGVRGVGRPAFCFLVACQKRHLKLSSRLTLEESQKRVRLNKGNIGKGKGGNRATFGTLAWSWSTKRGRKACPTVPKLAKEKKELGAGEENKTARHSPTTL